MHECIVHERLSQMLRLKKKKKKKKKKGKTRKKNAPQLLVLFKWALNSFSMHHTG